MDTITHNIKFHWIELLITKLGITIIFSGSEYNISVIIYTKDFEFEIIYNEQLEYKSRLKFINNNWFNEITNFEIDINGVRIDYDEKNFVLKISSNNFLFNLSSFDINTKLNILNGWRADGT